ALLEERPAEHELCVAELDPMVDAAAHEDERATRETFGLLELAGAELNLCKRRDRICGLDVASEIEQDRERLLELLACVFRPAEQEGEPAEVVQAAADAEDVA